MTMYFIAIVLPQDLNAEIITYKKMMLEKWGCKVGLKSPAHITLIPPSWLPPEVEKEIISDLDHLAKHFSPFVIDTINFSSFKPRTIFIDVVLSNELNEVKKVVNNFFKQNTKYAVKTDNRPFHPHITIATRDFSKSVFAEAWPYFQEKEFTKSFTASGISLLRHNGAIWDIIHTAQFAKSNENCTS